MATFDNTVKAKKILRITGVAESRSRPRLMNLPRELRDVIWEYVLVEPTLCDKRHQPGCDFYEPHAAAEAPPIELLDGHWIPQRRWERYLQRYVQLRFRRQDERNVRCRELCVRRKGLALLQVSRQVHHETAPIFWGQNVICLRLTSEARDARLIMWDRDYREQVARVQRVMVWYHDQLSYSWSHDTYLSETFDLLQDMPELRRLELPSTFLKRQHNRERLLTLSNVVELRLWQFVHYRPPIESEPMRYVKMDMRFLLGAYLDFTLAGDHQCIGHGTNQVAHRCSKGSNAIRSIGDMARTWSAIETDYRVGTDRSTRDWLRAAIDELELQIGTLTRNIPGPRVLDVSIVKDGASGRVVVWGLPSYTAREWATTGPAIRKKEAFKKLAATTRQPTYRQNVQRAHPAQDNHQDDVQMEHENEHQDESFRCKADRRRRHPRQPQSLDHQKVLSDRERRHHRQHAQELSNKKSAERREELDRHEQKAAQAAERKASSKRVRSPTTARPEPPPVPPRHESRARTHV